MDTVIRLLPTREQFKIAIEEQGRKVSWIAQKLNYTTAHIYNFLNGDVMREEKVAEFADLLGL